MSTPQITVATVATVAEGKNGVAFSHLISLFLKLLCFTVVLKIIKEGTNCSILDQGLRRFGVPSQSVRRTRSHRIKFCVQKGLGGAALNKQTAGNVSVY